MSRLYEAEFFSFHRHQSQSILDAQIRSDVWDGYGARGDRYRPRDRPGRDCARDRRRKGGDARSSGRRMVARRGVERQGRPARADPGRRKRRQDRRALGGAAFCGARQPRRSRGETRGARPLPGSANGLARRRAPAPDGVGADRRLRLAGYAMLHTDPMHRTFAGLETAVAWPSTSPACRVRRSFRQAAGPRAHRARRSTTSLPRGRTAPWSPPSGLARIPAASRATGCHRDPHLRDLRRRVRPRRPAHRSGDPDAGPGRGPRGCDGGPAGHPAGARPGCVGADRAGAEGGDPPRPGARGRDAVPGRHDRNQRAPSHGGMRPQREAVAAECARWRSNRTGPGPRPATRKTCAPRPWPRRGRSRQPASSSAPRSA